MLEGRVLWIEWALADDKHIQRIIVLRWFPMGFKLILRRKVVYLVLSGIHKRRCHVGLNSAQVNLFRRRTHDFNLFDLLINWLTFRLIYLIIIILCLCTNFTLLVKSLIVWFSSKGLSPLKISFHYELQFRNVSLPFLWVVINLKLFRFLRLFLSTVDCSFTTRLSWIIWLFYPSGLLYLHVIPVPRLAWISLMLCSS